MPRPFLITRMSTTATETSRAVLKLHIGSKKKKKTTKKKHRGVVALLLQRPLRMQEAAIELTTEPNHRAAPPNQ